MAGDDLGGDLKQLLDIAQADTTQLAVALSTALQEGSSRKLIQGRLNVSVAALAKSTIKLGMATWVLVALTTVLAVLTGVLVWTAS